LLLLSLDHCFPVLSFQVLTGHPDLLLITTSNVSELFGGIDIDDLEPTK